LNTSSYFKMLQTIDRNRKGMGVKCAKLCSSNNPSISVTQCMKVYFSPTLHMCCGLASRALLTEALRGRGRVMALKEIHVLINPRNL
jgi:hypothetical protein